MKYKLTEEGKEYLKSGLPEKRLVDLLDSLPQKSAKIGKIALKVKNFPIALKWAMEKGWVIKRGDEIILLRKPEEVPEQEALEKIEKGEEVSSDMLKILIQRKLVMEEKENAFKIAQRFVGKEVDNLTPELIKTRLWKRVILKTYNVEVPGKKIYPGKIHPYRQVIEEVREKLLAMGFVEARGPYVELNFWNCDALFMPSDHPAREIHSMFFLKKPKYGKVMDKKLWKRVSEVHKKGWGSWDFELARRLVLRSQCTAVSARTMYKLKERDLPHKMFIIDRVFRPDTIDAKHFIEFEQCEGIVVGKGLNFRHLLGYLKEIACSIVSGEKVRFKPSYFPFTEPSVEGFVYHKKLGWVEFGGAGIFRPEVTRPFGIKVPVLAWGLGLGRLAMLKLGIDDIRHLYSDDLEWLRKNFVR